jgi:hypothetical protein
MVAFDLWVGVEDRNNDNLVVDGDFRSDQPTAHIDYSWSLSKQWTRGNYRRSVIDQYTGPFGGLIREEQKAMADQIATFDKQIIETIVSRVPEGFLPKEKAELIIEGLTNGQQIIHRLLGL